MKIPKQIIDELISHAIAEAPLEACGYLAGKDGTITKAYKMTNTDQSNIHFSFAPEEQFRVVKAARKEGTDLIAVYHSHPETPARPSKEDIRLAHDPCVSYVIVSLAEGNNVIKSFKINGETVAVEPIEII
ncbi:MAG: M67 family metallopeptidase [Deltaproteobacteria bacterium]|nr:M67 family metallopeptidase [Deltaproteobacteria bacterium]